MENNKELLLQKEKKQLYKNWKLYAVALGIITIGLSVGLGIGFGVHNNEQINPNDLKNLKLNTTLTTPYTNQQTAFDAFLTLNSTVNDLKDNVETTTFTAPTYATFGSLAIKAKENSKYIGTLTITIPKLAQTNLKQMITIKTISGEGITTENQALQAVAKTIGWSNLNDFAEVETFTAATYTTDGSLTITAKENNIYTGSVTITITKLTQTELSTLGLNTLIAVAQNATQDEVFQTFLDKNTSILGDTLTLEQVELTNFQPVEIVQNGKLTITVKAEINNKYTGSIEIATKYILSDTNISDVIRYLSDNNLLNFNIPTGTQKGDDGSNLLAVLITKFRELMNGNYEYANNVKSIELNTYNQAPNQDELDTKGHVWHSPSNLSIWVTTIFKDGNQKTIQLDNINATITMV